MNGLALLSVVASLCCLGFGAYQDLKTRSVSNWVWVALALSGGLLSAVNFWLGGLIISYLSMAGVAVILSFVLWSKLGFGAADAKALMGLGLALPFQVPFVVLFALPFALGYAGVAALKRKEKMSLKVGVPYVSCLFAGLIVAEVVLTFSI